MCSEISSANYRPYLFRSQCPSKLWTFMGRNENFVTTLQWRHNERGSVSNHQPHGCLLKRWFRRRSKKTSKFRVTGICAGDSPGTGEFPAQMASTAENVSIWWRHHEKRDNYTPQYSVGCNYLSLPEMPVSETKATVLKIMSRSRTNCTSTYWPNVLASVPNCN